MEEGRGFRIGGLGGKKVEIFYFHHLIQCGEQRMEKLSFAPLSVVDYGGGIIITDWFSEEK